MRINRVYPTACFVSKNGDTPKSIRKTIINHDHFVCTLFLNKPISIGKWGCDHQKISRKFNRKTSGSDQKKWYFVKNGEFLRNPKLEMLQRHRLTEPIFYTGSRPDQSGVCSGFEHVFND